MKNTFYYSDELSQPEQQKSTTYHSNNETVEHPISYVESAREGMGLLHGIKYDWKNSKAIMAQVEGITHALLEKQRKSIEYQIMIDLDTEKKKRYKSYIQEIYKVDQSIYSASHEAQDYLQNYMNHAIQEMLKNKKSYRDSSQVMVEKGEILEEDANKFNQIVSKWTNANISNIEYKLQLLFQQYTESYANTLELLKTKVDEWDVK